jgi:hypothetical protein
MFDQKVLDFIFLKHLFIFWMVQDNTRLIVSWEHFRKGKTEALQEYIYQI